MGTGTALFLWIEAMYGEEAKKVKKIFLKAQG